MKTPKIVFEINKQLGKHNLQVVKVFPRPFEKFIKGTDLVGAEIGVYKGEHAVSMIKRINPKRLYLVDGYKLYDNYEDGKRHYGIDQDDLETAEKIADKINYDCIERIKESSEDATRKIKEPLDFVYIDAEHSYDAVKKDIALWYPKVKKGGVIGGHDFDNGIVDEHSGVVQAVIEFVNANKLKLYVGYPDWWVVKE